MIIHDLTSSCTRRSRELIAELVELLTKLAALGLQLMDILVIVICKKVEQARLVLIVETVELVMLRVVSDMLLMGILVNAMSCNIHYCKMNIIE
mgnify:CR=1 FL=1